MRAGECAQQGAAPGFGGRAMFRCGAQQRVRARQWEWQLRELTHETCTAGGACVWGVMARFMRNRAEVAMLLLTVGQVVQHGKVDVGI